MALARALTTIGKRSHKSDDDPIISSFVGRAASQRAGKPIVRTEISSPLALVSTSNMQVHNAKNIAGTAPIEIRQVESATSSNASVSGDESDHSAVLSGNEAQTDASSFDESPIRSEPEPNHLSCYFKPTVDTNSSPTTSPTVEAFATFDESPRVPKRVPSHSKRAHERVHRTRSLQRMMSPSPRQGITRSATDSLTMTTETISSDTPTSESPFGPELAQLDKIAEEFGQGASKVEVDPEAEYMEAHGLVRFAAEDYVSEIQALIVETFGQSETMAWF